MAIRVGCDIGGTFTDLILFDDSTCRMQVLKVPSTPRDFARAVLEGSRRLLREAGVSPADVSFLVHSSTVALNTLVERKGAVTGLLTTAGFRDVLEIGRAARAHEYDLFQSRPAPLVPRHLRLTVAERIDHTGEVLRPLDEDGVRQAARRFRAEGVESIAVVFLHSYANPAHEIRAREILRDEYPGCPVYISAEINPIYREYERSASTAINAYVAPRTVAYLRRLRGELEEIGFGGTLYITRGSGGLMTAEAAMDRAIHMLMAGPAAGLTSAAYLGGLAGYENVLAIDTGGTTQLVGLVEEGRISPTITGQVGGFPVRVPIVDVRAIGAGGGSIARVDAGGILQVGPDSAGADPGPACYGRGGKEPTITDADVVLGYLNPEHILGGELRLDRRLAEEAIAARIARPLGLSVREAAAGIVAVANTKRASLIRQILIEKGHDPRDFTMVAFGGAGPVHAAQLMRDVGVARVLVPPHPGLASPLGALSAELRRDHVRSVGDRVEELDMGRLRRTVAELWAEAIAEMEREGIGADQLLVELSADMKYVGQLGELTVSLPDLAYEPSDRARLAELFFAEHERLFSYVVRDEGVVLTNLRLTVRHRFPDVRLPEYPEAGADAGRALRSSRPVYFGELGGARDCPVYARERLRPGNRIEGPAVIEEYDSTTVVYPGQRAVVDRYLNLIITAADAS